jgi:WD40 repeat protein
MMSGMTGAERAEVMVRMTFGPNHGIEFSPDGALLATVSSDATARLWDAASGAHLATLVPLPSGGYITLLPDGRYKLDGDPGDCLWWAAGLSRLGPAEVSSRFPEVRRLPPGAPIFPA